MLIIKIAIAVSLIGFSSYLLFQRWKDVYKSEQSNKRK